MMPASDSLRAARLLALAAPMALLVGAYVSQYGFGLFPCEMCWWQRYPHMLAIALAALALLRPTGRILIMLAALAIAASGAVGLFHAGVEYGWWQGFTACTTNVVKGGDPLEAIMNAPMIRCDVPQWTLLGVSLAGFNFLFSGAAAAAIFALVLRKGQA